MEDKTDENYYVAILHRHNRDIVRDEKFQTLEEVLGFLHRYEEPKNIADMFRCLMGLRDGESEVLIQRDVFFIGKQILRIKPPERFQKLFLEGNALRVKE